jgi:hypothetical protein
MFRSTVVIILVLLIIGGLIYMGMEKKYIDSKTFNLASIVAALIGLGGIAITHALNAYAEREKDKKERLQDARGLARALASEIGILGHLLLRQGHTLSLLVGQNSVKLDDLRQFIALPSQAVFDKNIDKIALLEVIEECGEFEEHEERFVERIVGFYEGIMDVRWEIQSAKLQRRHLTLNEIQRIEQSIREKAHFALSLSKRLHEFTELSETRRSAFRRPHKRCNELCTKAKGHCAVCEAQAEADRFVWFWFKGGVFIDGFRSYRV